MSMTRYQTWMNNQNLEFIRAIHTKVVPERYIEEVVYNNFGLEELKKLDEIHCLRETNTIPEGKDD